MYFFCNRPRPSGRLAVSSVEVRSLPIGRKLPRVLILWHFVLWRLALSYFGAFLLWCFPMLISSTRVLTRAPPTFACFLGPLLTQLHADLCADPPGCLNPVAGTVVYRKLLGEASAELSKASKLTAVTIPFYLTSVRCQPTSSTTFLQSPLQLSIVLASLPVQPVAKLGFDPLVLPTCRSQFRGPVTLPFISFRH